MRSAEIDTFPELDCVRTVVSSTLGVTKSQYEQIEGGTAITLSGLKPEEPTHTILYGGSEESQIVGALQIYRDVRGGIFFDQSLIEINNVPPQSQIDASRPVMKQIEHDLANKCGLPELPTRIKEHCQRVKCGRLQ
jgi:hypothetical protein